MAVRIRLKKMGRKHRPYFRICAMDSRTPRDGKAIEELGTYDPMIRDTDKRCTMKADRIDYWVGVGAQPTEKVKILIDKYKGKVPDIRVDQRILREIPNIEAPPPKPEPEPEPVAQEPVAKETAEAKAEEAPAAEEKSAEEEKPAEAEAEAKPTEDAKSEEKAED